jgi:hypothetical protein
MPIFGRRKAAAANEIQLLDTERKEIRLFEPVVRRITGLIPAMAGPEVGALRAVVAHAT